MTSHLMRRMAVMFASGIAFIAGSPFALALNVQPVIVDLLSTGRQASAIISLQNTFADAVPVEVTAHPVRLVNGELQEMEEESADDLLVFPAQAIVSAGATQAFRVQWVGDPQPGASEHFYVTVAQLPVALPENQNAIQVLHRFRVLVSVGAPDAEPALKIVKAEIQEDENGKAHPKVSFSNSGQTYGYVGRNRMTIVQNDPSGNEVFRQSYEPEQIQQWMGLGLIPSGQTRALPISVDLPQSSGTVKIDLTPAASD